MCVYALSEWKGKQKCNAIEWGDKAQTSKKIEIKTIVTYAIFVYLKFEIHVVSIHFVGILHFTGKEQKKNNNKKKQTKFKMFTNEAFLMTVGNNSWKLLQSPFAIH